MLPNFADCPFFRLTIIGGTGLLCLSYFLGDRGKWISHFSVFKMKPFFMLEIDFNENILIKGVDA